MHIPIYIVDAFTKGPFKGNQAGVCLLKNQLDDQILQNIAFEMNLSETAFIISNDEKKDFSQSKSFKLRWFTPKNEIDLCGHATLASAHILLNELHNTGEIVFDTLSGYLTVSLENNKLKMDFPINESTPAKPISEVISYLSLNKKDIIAFEYDKNLANYLIEVQNENVLRQIEPDFLGLSKYTSSDIKITGIIVTSKGEGFYDFSSRYFAPWVGINEDPVTGSSHTTLAPYWRKKLHKNLFQTIQLSKRTGTMEVKIEGQRVIIKGSAFTTLQGSFIIEDHL